MNVIVLAQGRQTRLPDLDCPKQYIKVAGEPIIERIGRLFMPEGPGPVSPMLAVCWYDLKRLIIEGPFRFLTLADPGNCILKGFVQTRRFWASYGERTLIILGDVYFTDAAAKKILEDERDCFFAGTKVLGPSTGELFAFSFKNPDKIAKALSGVACLKVNAPDYQCGHLRNLLWQLQGGVRDRIFEEIYLEIDDLTCDFDKPEDLNKIARIEASYRGSHGV